MGFYVQLDQKNLERTLTGRSTTDQRKLLKPLFVYITLSVLELNVLQIQNHVVQTHGFSVQHTKVWIS